MSTEPPTLGEVTAAVRSILRSGPMHVEGAVEHAAPQVLMMLTDARNAGRQEILDELGVELLSHARAAADSLEGDLGLVRLIATRLTDYGVQ